MQQMVFTYGLQYLDKAVLGFAAVYTLRQDNVSLNSSQPRGSPR
jgi:hypothetical protein